jgi:DNA-binding CsgD family transcriptional regulator/PAS domain-containing protein
LRSRDAQELIEKVYQAPLVPGGWVAALQEIADGFAAPVAFSAWMEATFTASRYYCVGLPAEEYGEFVAPGKNPWSAELGRRSLAAPLPSRLVIRAEDLLPQVMARHTEHYERFNRPLRAEFGALVITSRTGAGGALSIWRDRAFPDQALATLHRLEPHITRAQQVTAALLRAEERGCLACAALEVIGSIVLVVDARGRVRFANAAARDLLRAGAGLCVARQRLETQRPEETAQLQRLVRDAALAPSEAYLQAGGTMSVTRRSGLPLELHVAPLAPSREGDWPVGDLALLIARDPDAVPPSAVQFLNRRFGLTLAEARLALILLNGSGATDAAEQLGVSNATVRSHLQHIFEKTGTRRQAELVRLLATHPALSLRRSDR